MNFEELTQVALIGTERQALRAFTESTPLADLLRTLNCEQKEQSLLSAAALTSTHQRAGRLPTRDQSPAPEPSPVETLPQVSFQARTALRRLLEGEHQKLLGEWLALAATAKVIAPPELLPLLLNAGASELRLAILPVLGERGRWLAAQNPEWSWVAGGVADESVWQTGTTPARVLYLRQQRETNPARALELLVSTWKEETPEGRAAFIAELETGLSPNDESFLETALDDKRKEVRRIAAQLLAHLPSSALVRRMVERARPMLQFTLGKPGGLLKLQLAKKPPLEVTLPAECDKAMQRDGIEPKPQRGMGEKTWWLRQLLDAWMQGAIFQKNAAWAEALFAVAVEQNQIERFQGLLLALPISAREIRLAQMLARSDSPDLHTALLAQCGHQWGLKFSRTVLNWLRRIIERSSADWTVRSQIKEFASRLHPATLNAAAQDWKTEAPEWEFWSKGMDEFLAIVQLRSDVHSAFGKGTQNSLTH